MSAYTRVNMSTCLTSSNSTPQSYLHSLRNFNLHIILKSSPKPQTSTSVKRPLTTTLLPASHSHLHLATMKVLSPQQTVLLLAVLVATVSALENGTTSQSDIASPASLVTAGEKTAVSIDTNTVCALNELDCSQSSSDTDPSIKKGGKGGGGGGVTATVGYSGASFTRPGTLAVVGLSSLFVLMWSIM
ncbi:hypothetical protein GGR57DRAFT_486030 [Xylariaceae sp. FL1272]|nr:hypothetical protein GGR57DRAFT_486030 [Xylariaceae sp. FL1272]